MRLSKFVAAAIVSLLATVSSAAQAADISVPTSGWLVGPATLIPAADGAKMPCVMAVQYSNGFTARISGGGNALKAIALDVRQAAFKPGERYGVNLRIDNVVTQRVAALAHDSETLILDTDKIPGFYDAVRDGDTMQIGIGNTTSNLALFGARDGLSRLENCFGTKQAAAATPSAPQPMPQENTGFRTLSKEQPRAAVTEPGSPIAAAPAQAVEVQALEQSAPSAVLPMPEPEMIRAEPEGQEGDDPSSIIGAMLDRAARTLSREEPAAGNMAPPEPEAVPVARPASVPEQTTPPTGTALAREWTDAAPVSAPVQTGSLESQMRWRAVKGGNLRDILIQWTGNVGVGLDWRARKDYGVPSSVSLQGRLDEAVGVLFSEYEAGGPVSRLERDANGRTMLVVTDN